MALPLPRVVADVQAGGPLVTSMMGTNELTKSNLENAIKRVEAQYKPITTQAEAASKLAYANLMGPQFVAKMLGNQDIAANLSQPQLENAISTSYRAGTGQGSGNAMMGNMMQPNNMPDPLQNPIMALIAKGIQSLRGGTQQQGMQPQNAMQQGAQPQGMMQQGGNNLLSSPVLSSQDRQAVSQLQPGQSYVVQGNQPQAPSAPAGTYFERAARASDIKEEGKELGKKRAEAIDDMDQQYQQAVQAEVPVKRLMDISQSPVFMNMRNKIPFFQDKQLTALSKIGTPEEQKLIGDFVTSTTNAVANTVNSFGGRALVKEFDIGERMKISPNDTWNVMVGKLGSIGTYNEMTKQRARLASQLMEKEHINRGDALERADKMVDGAAIRKSIEQKLDPKPSAEDILYMANKYNTTPDEIKRRLKARGKL